MHGLQGLRLVWTGFFVTVFVGIFNSERITYKKKKKILIRVLVAKDFCSCGCQKELYDEKYMTIPTYIFFDKTINSSSN